MYRQFSSLRESLSPPPPSPPHTHIGLHLPPFADQDANGGDAMFLVAPYSRDDGWASCWTRPRPERPVLGRLIALARTSADYLVEWLSSEGELGTHAGGWQSSFRYGKKTRSLSLELCVNYRKFRIARRQSFRIRISRLHSGGDFLCLLRRENAYLIRFVWRISKRK